VDTPLFLSFNVSQSAPRTRIRTSAGISREQQEHTVSRKLYVGNLPYSIGEGELQELFSKAGNVESVKVMRDMATGRARGFAFVEMATDEEAQKAIAEFNEYELGGRALAVNEARPKPASSGAGGGGGFGGGRGRGGGGGGRNREPRW